MDVLVDPVKARDSSDAVPLVATKLGFELMYFAYSCPPVLAPGKPTSAENHD